MSTTTSTPRARALRLKNGTELPIREAKVESPEERRRVTEEIAGSIKTDVVVDRSFYRDGRS